MKKFYRGPLKTHMPLFALLLTLFALAALPACRQAATPDARLLRAEALMDEHPDSALALLQDLAPTAMNAGADSCLYRLLTAEANCKNHLGLENDTLLQSTIDYFKDRDDALHLSKAYYYAGRRQESSGNLREALIMFIRSKHVAETDTLWFRAGMAASAMGDISTRTGDTGDAITTYSQAVDLLKKSGKDSYVEFGRVHKALALARAGCYEESETILRDSISSAARREIPFLDYYTNSSLAAILTSRFAYSDAYPFLLSACNSGLAQAEDSLRLSYVLTFMGNVSAGREILEKYGPSDGRWYYLAKYAAFNAEGNYKEALLCEGMVNRDCEQADKLRINEEFHNLIEEVENERERIWVATERERQHRKIMTIGLIGLLLLIGALVIFRQKRIHRKETEKTNSQLRRLNESIKDEIDQRNRVEYELDQSRQMLNSTLDEKDMYATLVEDFRKHLMELQGKADEEAVQSETLQANNRAYVRAINKLFSTVEAVRDNRLGASRQKLAVMDTAHRKNLTEFIDVINSRHHGILDILGERLPNISEIDRIVIGMEISGFSLEVIAYLLGYDNSRAISTRRTRIKDKLKNNIEPYELEAFSILPNYYLHH